MDGMLLFGGGYLQDEISHVSDDSRNMVLLFVDVVETFGKNV
jgi:hypothetical protein